MYKLLFALLFIFGLALAAPKQAYAQTDNENTLRHAYKPYLSSDKQWMTTRINNTSSTPQKRLVCVEAFNVANNHKTHIGCTWLTFASYNSQEMWGVEINAPLSMLASGTYRVVYTYQGDTGKWHKVKSMMKEVLDGQVIR